MANVQVFTVLTVVDGIGAVQCLYQAQLVYLESSAGRHDCNADFWSANTLWSQYLVLLGLMGLCRSTSSILTLTYQS